MKILMIRFLLLLIFLYSQSKDSFGQKNWIEISSVEDLNDSYPDMIKGLFDHIDLQHPGLEKVKAAYSGGELIRASQLLLDYYKKGDFHSELRKETPPNTNETLGEADTILNNVFVIQNVRGQLPYTEDGHRDWHYKGPNNDREWAWLSNRHTQLNTILETYLKTGNPKYAKYIDLFLRDFILKSMPYPAVKSSTSVWRGLEVAARGKIWSRIFYGLINNEYMSPATQLLILASLPDHAHYNRNFHGGNNWLTMEISALATIAAYFPEYKSTDDWLDYSISAMTASMKDQVYPDGVQTELTSHYHNVSLHNFELFQDICKKANKELPAFFTQTIEDMYHYIAHAVRPDGHRLLNNDGDRGSDRLLILEGAKKFDKPDWEYIATNGNSGTRPVDGPSYFYPWAGHLISRSGYDGDAHWSFFDLGPWGSGHQHNDKLHLSISVYGKDLLVDAGRFAYTGEVAEKFRDYARGSEGHNVLLIDGKGQEAGPTHATAALDSKHYRITEDFDYASSSFDKFVEIEGKAAHTRTVFYVRGEFWIVVDKISTDRPRKIEALWHWHPESQVIKEQLTVKTKNKKGNLAIIPIGNPDFQIQMVKGQENPNIQGWYSPEYNVFGPNMASIYHLDISGNTTIAWLILPYENEPPPVETAIISENEDEISIEVKSNGEVWQLNLPYINSKNVSLRKP